MLFLSQLAVDNVKVIPIFIEIYVLILALKRVLLNMDIVFHKDFVEMDIEAIHSVNASLIVVKMLSLNQVIVYVMRVIIKSMNNANNVHCLICLIIKLVNVKIFVDRMQIIMKQMKDAIVIEDIMF